MKEPKLLSEALRHDLIVLVDTYQKLTGVSDSTLSRAVDRNDSAFVRRLRDGENFTVQRAARFERFLRREIAKELAKLNEIAGQS